MENVVKRIVIKKLYDLYDYDIPFDRGGISIITGPNGYGKTSILKIIENALDLNFWYFFDLLYEYIFIYLSDDTILSFKKEDISGMPEPSSIFDEIGVERYSEGDRGYEVKVEHLLINGPTLASICLTEHRYNDLMRRVAEIWNYKMTAEGISNEKIDDSTKSMSIMDGEIRKNFTNLRAYCNDHNCLFVKEQRIMETKRYTINTLAEEIKKMYEEANGRYAAKSQLIDSTFIQRQIKNSHESYPESQYKEKIKELKEIISNYQQYGLIDKYNLSEDYTPELRMILSMHIDDMMEKFGEYESFYNKLATFDECVSGKGLSNKKMVLNPRNGIMIFSDTGRLIPLDKLSSGEQNLVILYYKLIFETSENTLLCIDEPENSIHIEWLEKMLDDYIKLQDITKCQMIIATHSPTFINGHWDKAYDLFGGLYQDWMK